MLREAKRIREARVAEQLRVSRTQVLRKIDCVDVVPALKEIHRKLELAGAVAYICSATLRDSSGAVSEFDLKPIVSKQFEPDDRP